VIYLAVLAVVAAVAMGFLALRAFQAQAALKMKAGPLDHARPGGMVHLMGRVAPMGELLESPLAGQECVYYRSVVEVYHPPRHNDEHGWTEVELAEEDWVDFVIEDATGRVKVEADGARFILEKDLVEREKVGGAPARREFLGLDVTGRDRRPTRTQKETFIEPGDLVRVVGRARGSAPRADTDNPTMVVGKAGSPVFVVTDKPKGEVLEGFSGRGLAYTFGAVLLLGVAVVSVGIGLMPPPEADPVRVDTSLKPIERPLRPSSD